jgi:hypothetical protein
MRTRLFIALLLLLPAALYAQTQTYATITASGIKDEGGNLLSSGELCFLPVSQTTGLPMNYTVVGDGQRSRAAVCSPIANGVVTPFQLTNTLITWPSNACYRVTVTDITGAPVIGSTSATAKTGYQCVQMSSSWCSVPSGVYTCNWDQYAPDMSAQVTVAAPTLTGGTWATGAPGSNVACTVNVAGAAPNYQLSCSIPQGAIGPQGPTGATGAQGPAGTPAVGSIAGLSGDGTGNVTISKQLIAGTVAAVAVHPSLYPYADVVAYGAKGDCATDDTAAIQSATGHYAIVYFPAAPGGCYKITAAITATPSTTLGFVGAGWQILGTNGPFIGSSIEQFTPNTDAFDITCNIAVTCSNFSIKHIAVMDASGTLSSANGISITGPSRTWNGDRISLEDVTVLGFRNQLNIYAVANITGWNNDFRALAAPTRATTVTSASSTTTTATYNVPSIPSYLDVGSPVWSLGNVPNGYNSPLGLLSGIYVSGGTFVGSAGQTCTLSSFVGQGGVVSTGTTATITLTGTNTIATNTPLAVTAAGVAVAGDFISATLSNGTAVCSGTAGILTAIAPAPYVVSAWTPTSVTVASTNNPGTPTLVGTLMFGQPGYAIWKDGSAGNSIVMSATNANCGSESQGPWGAGAVSLNGPAGSGSEFDFLDTNTCVNVLTNNNASTVAVHIRNSEVPRGPIVNTTGGNVTVHKDTVSNGSYLMDVSPYTKAYGTLTLVGVQTESTTVPLVTALDGDCQNVTVLGTYALNNLSWPSQGMDCYESVSGTMGYLGTLPQVRSNNVPAASAYIRGALVPVRDTTGTGTDGLRYYYNSAGTPTYTDLLNPSFSSLSITSSQTLANKWLLSITGPYGSNGAAGNITYGLQTSAWLMPYNSQQYNSVAATNGVNQYSTETMWMANGYSTSVSASQTCGFYLRTAITSTAQIPIMTFQLGTPACPNLTPTYRADFSAATGGFIVPYLIPALVYSAAGTPIPTCGASLKGAEATVSDATSPTYMGAYTSGGTITVQAICSYNGTTYAWLTH